MSPPVVRKARLGRMTLVATGGFGKVFKLEKFRLQADPTPLAYKEFAIDKDAQATSAEAATSFRHDLSPEDRDELDRYSTWPRALVEESPGRICGLLMPLIPEDFFCQQTDPDSGNLTSRPREMGWLIATPEQRAAAHVNLAPVDTTDRLILLAQLIYAIGRLHKHGWVFGDLSFKNAAFALDPPRLKLLDCDGAAALTDQSRNQASTPFWEPPECQSGQQAQQDRVTDVYKLGLAILRCVVPGKGAATSKSPGRIRPPLDAQAVALVARAISGDRRLRPTAKDLYTYFYELVRSRIIVPEIKAARLTKPFILRGGEARIEWHIENGTTATISVGSNRPVPVDLAAHPDGYGFRPEGPGPVSIEVANQFSMVVAALGDLELYDLPAFNVDFGSMSAPQVPAVEAFTLAPLAEILDTAPRVSIPEIPPVPSLHSLELVESLTPDRPASVPWPLIDEAVIGASNSIRDAILAEGNKFVSELREIKVGGGK
jgi:serine/threonine protein kinase